MSIGSPRRFYLLKRFAAADQGEIALASVWRAKQEELPGTELTEFIPSLSRLNAAGYSTVEDLIGSTTAELRKRASLSRREAEAALVALESL